LWSLCQYMTISRYFSGNARIYLQWIHIKEPLTIQLHSTDRSIIKSSLHHICKFSIRINFQHLLRKEYKTDGCTGFRICHIIRKIIIHGKGLQLSGRSNTCGQIHSSFSNTLPQCQTCLIQLIISVASCQICHRCIHIHCPNRMSNRILLIIDRGIALIISGILRINPKVSPFAPLGFFFKEMRILSSFINKVIGQFTISFFSGYMIQTHQSNLYFLMSRNSTDLSFPFSKAPVNMICHPAHNLQQPILSGDLIVCCRCLHHMSCTVKLMALL